MEPIGNTSRYFPVKSFMDNLIDIRIGSIPGYRFFQRNIYTPQPSTTYYSTFWAFNSPSLYPFLTVAQVLNVSSDNVSDTLAGTGARTIRIEGLDANYEVVLETVNLNGQTAVPTVNSYLRINAVTCTSFGTSERNEGSIYVGSGIVAGNGTNPITQGYVRANKVFSEVGVLTVPQGYTLLGFGSQISVAAGKEAIVRVRTRLNASSPWDFTAATSLLHTQNEKFSPQLTIGSERTDIEFQALADTANTQVSGQFQLALLDNGYL